MRKMTTKYKYYQLSFKDRWLKINLNSLLVSDFILFCANFFQILSQIYVFDFSIVSLIGINIITSELG